MLYHGLRGHNHEGLLSFVLGQSLITSMDETHVIIVLHAGLVATRVVAGELTDKRRSELAHGRVGEIKRLLEDLNVYGETDDYQFHFTGAHVNSLTDVDLHPVVAGQVVSQELKEGVKGLRIGRVDSLRLHLRLLLYGQFLNQHVVAGLELLSLLHSEASFSLSDCARA